MQLGKKRRPTSSSRSHRGKFTGSYLQQPRPLPHPNILILRKYLHPALQEEQKHNAYLISQFISGCRSKDILGIAQNLAFYPARSLPLVFYSHPLNTLSSNIIKGESKRILPVLKSSLGSLLKENIRKKGALSCGNSKELKSTAITSKKQIIKSTSTKKSLHNILGQHFETCLNQSEEMGKLGKCLKKVLGRGKSENGQQYRAFVGEMERKGQIRKEENKMMKMILNLEQDFSSIQESTPFDSKQSIYGLSQLKNNNYSKINPKKEKKSSQIFLKHLNTQQINNLRSPNTSQSKKSKSLTRNHTPEHRFKSKSKSTKKNILRTKGKIGESQKGKNNNTEKLYFQQEKQLKSSVREKNREHLKKKIPK